VRERNIESKTKNFRLSLKREEGSRSGGVGVRGSERENERGRCCLNKRQCLKKRQGERKTSPALRGPRTSDGVPTKKARRGIPRKRIGGVVGRVKEVH